jgi:hypothetical protein
LFTDSVIVDVVGMNAVFDRLQPRVVNAFCVFR